MPSLLGRRQICAWKKRIAIVPFFRLYSGWGGGGKFCGVMVPPPRDRLEAWEHSETLPTVG